MPEINEVRQYADFIKSKLKNKNITHINILNGRYKKHGPFENYSHLVNHLPLKIIDVKTKGKFMYIKFEHNLYLFTTLGLSGGWIFKTNSSKVEHPIILEYLKKEAIDSYMTTSLKHLNVEFKTAHGSLYFYDTLSFGTLKVVDDEKELEKKLKSVGPDIMDEETDFKVFQDAICKPKNLKKVIGIVLMDQKTISGIGNYLRADILWLSKISPFRKVDKLSEEELKKIYHNALVLTWGQYNKKKALNMKILTKKDKLPSDYDRDFFVYYEDEDIHGNKVTKEELFEGSQKRFIYWVKNYQL